jgi:hypothetical protein
MLRLRTAVVAVAFVSSVGACKHDAPITSCTQDLHGTWRSEAGARWMILDSGASLEIYPMFDDGKPAGVPPDLETAPRVIDLSRQAEGLSGDVQRRFMRADQSCVAKAGVHVTACTNNVLELVLADPPPPLAFDPCSFPRPDSSRRERWRRE